MDEDMRLFISEWLKDTQNDVWNKSLSSNCDMIEAIYSLIEEWKSNKDVKAVVPFVVMLQFINFYTFTFSYSTFYVSVYLDSTEKTIWNPKCFHYNLSLV